LDFFLYFYIQLSGDVEILSAPDLLTESPSAAVYMDLRRRTIMATPPTGRRYQYRPRD